MNRAVGGRTASEARRPEPDFREARASPVSGLRASPVSGKEVIADLAEKKKTLPCDAVFEAKILEGTRVECTYTSGGKVCCSSVFDL